MNAVTREMTFFSGGFFGYGEKGDFKAFSLAHILPILLGIAAVLLNQNFTDASYMYLKHGSFAMLDFLPDSLWVMYLIMFSAVLILFAITWLIYRLVQKHAAKSAETDS